MSAFLSKLNEQLKSCKNLLTILQNERSFYQKKGNVSPKEVITILERKNKLVSTFEENQVVLSNLKRNSTNNPTEQDRVKSSIRELAMVTEQLLVLDSENERMIKKMMNMKNHQKTQNITSSVRAAKIPKKQRNSLRTQLPFMPGSTIAQPAIISNVSAQPAVISNNSTTVKAGARRNKLHKYTKSMNILNSSDKYI